MADITKCKGDNCPIKDGCYRFTAEDNIQQSYFVEIPGKWIEKHQAGIELPQDYSGTISMKEFNCEMHWGLRQDEIMNILNDIVNGS